MNPLSQIIAVPKDYTSGLYISSIELFFHSKSQEAPITVEIGPLTPDGIPDYTTVYPFGKKTLYPSSVNTGVDGNTPTKFEFDVPIFLLPGRHYVSIRTNSKLYKLAASTIGSMVIGTENVINNRPVNISTFFYPNLSTQIPNETDTIKMNIKRCLFDVSLGKLSGEVTLYNDFPIMEERVVNNTDEEGNILTTEIVNQTTLDDYYSIFNIHSDYITHKNTTADFYYKKTDISGILDSTFSILNIGSNQEIEKSLLNLDKYQIKANISTTNNSVSSIIDLDRIHGTFVKHYINSDTTGEDGKVGGNSESKYVTKVIELSDDNKAADLVAYAFLLLPQGTDVEIYYKAAPTGTNIVTDSSYIKMVKKSLAPKKFNEFVEYKFTTTNEQALVSGDLFDKFIFKIVLLSNNDMIVPKVKDFRGIAVFE